MPSADRLCKIAVGQLGTSEYPPGSNIQKYGAEYGLNGQPWCAIFVWWCFKHAGLKCPYGKCAYVPTCATKMSKLHKGGAGQAKPGDIRIVAGQGHIGICVQSGGGVVAGNSGGRVSRESAGGTYYRPKCFGPDILPIKYNGKTYYYNPETKKLCSDKNGKNVIKTQIGTNSGSSNNKNSSGDTKSGSTENVYKEYYVTKYTEQTVPKDKVVVSGDIQLTKTIRINELTKDINKVLQLYKNNSELQTQLNNIKNVYDYTANSLYNAYKKLANFLQKQLINFNGNQNNYCFAISGNADELRYCYKIKYSDRNLNSNFKYYNFINDDWMNLFNDITLKRDAIKYYLETIKDYKSPLLAESYRTYRLNEVSEAYNLQLGSLLQQMDNYKKDHIQEIQIEDNLKNLNQQIESIELDLNSINKEIEYNYGENSQIKRFLNNYKKIKDNILNQKNNLFQNYFSNQYYYWNRDIINNPQYLNFWLEFLIHHKYSIKNIGLRSYVTTDSNIKTIYTREVPQIIYYSDKTQKKNKTGYNYLYIENINELFKNSAQGISAKSIIDNAVYQHSICSEEINLTTIPIHYLEPNTRIFVYNEKTKINNEYIIGKISKQLSYNGTMNTVATKVVDKLY